MICSSFDIEESEKHLTCGHGKALVVRYEGEELRIGILKNNRVKSEYDKIPEVMENQMTVEEILGYLESSGCNRCLIRRRNGATASLKLSQSRRRFRATKKRLFLKVVYRFINFSRSLHQ